MRPWHASRSTRRSPPPTGSPAGTRAAPTTPSSTPARRWRTTPRVLRSYLRFEQSVARWYRLDGTLAAIAELAAAARFGCSWSSTSATGALPHRRGCGRAPGVPVVAGQRRLLDLERAVLEYAEAMTADPLAVTDEMVAALRRGLDDAALVELTMLVATRTLLAVELRTRPHQPGVPRPCEIPMAGDEPPVNEDPFERQRALLIGAAYGVLGSRSMRRTSSRTRGSAGRRRSRRRRDAAAYLLLVTPNLALNRLLGRGRGARTTSGMAAGAAAHPRDVGDAAELAEEVSMALLVVLESLSPLERAVFVLREVFGLSRRRSPSRGPLGGGGAAGARRPASTWTPGGRASSPTAGPSARSPSASWPPSSAATSRP